MANVTRGDMRLRNRRIRQVYRELLWSSCQWTQGCQDIRKIEDDKSIKTFFKIFKTVAKEEDGFKLVNSLFLYPPWSKQSNEQ